MEPTLSFNLLLVAPLTAIIATPVQVLVSIVRSFFPTLAGKFLPPIGIGVGFLMALLVTAATGHLSNLSAVAQCGMAAIGGQIGAMAAVAIHNKATKVDERIDIALDLPKGSTKADVDKEIEKRSE